MNGKSHTVVNALSAIVVNDLFHTAGASYSWHQLAVLIVSPQLLDALNSQQFLHKVTYYLLVALCARLPDLDQRSWIGRLTGGHRGCTHSILSVLLLLLFFCTVAIGIPILLAMHGLVLVT